MQGVPARHPVGATLPAMLQEDPFLQRFTAGLDDVLAPFFATLDGLDRYVDPALAPEDFLGWLGGWVGIDLDRGWPVEVRRSVLRSAATVQEARGTARGLTDEVALLTGCQVEVRDPGGVASSAEPDGPLPTGCADDTGGAVVVRVHVCQLGQAEQAGQTDLLDPDSEARTRLARAVRAAVPAHLPVTVEVTS
jgi:phage tail-like protein